MQFLRNAHLLARFVLVWFALSIGVAMASPIVKPQAMELICSASGVMKVLLISDDGTQEVSGHTLDCPLCATSSAPPPLAAPGIEPPLALSYALLPIETARIAARIGTPWQARAPPAFS